MDFWVYGLSKKEKCSCDGNGSLIFIILLLLQEWKSYSIRIAKTIASVLRNWILFLKQVNINLIRRKTYEQNALFFSDEINLKSKSKKKIYKAKMKPV